MPERTKTPLPELDDFTRAYFEAALFADSPALEECSLCYASHPEGFTGDCRDDGNRYTDAPTAEDFAEEAVKRMVEDCATFQREHAAVLARAVEEAEDYDAGKAGHDFWLTRNRHGAGFWDRGLGEVGARLTDAAHAYGEVSPYFGDDGKIYLM